MIAGDTQTSAVDPLGENWGLLFTCTPAGVSCQGYQNLTRAFLWHNGVMTPLPTLGGDNSFSAGDALNNLGQVVGFAETSTQYPNCIAPQVLDWEAVVWEPKNGKVHELPPFPGDSIGAGLAINDKGQVVGTSGICAFPSFADGVHAVLCENGSVTDLGSLGGVTNNDATAINNRGQVVGFSDLAGDATGHAFLWQHGIMTDLGTLPGDYFSFAWGINNKGQVIAQSCDINFNCRATLWQHGVMTDLNTLTPPDSLYLVFASDINDRGEITGQGFDPETGYTLAFLAIPCDEKHATVEGCKDLATDATAAPDEASKRPKVILPENVRKQLQQRRGFRNFGAGLMRPQ